MRCIKPLTQFWNISHVTTEYVSKYNYIIVRPKASCDWLNLPHSSTLPPLVTVKHRVVKLQEVSLSEG